MQKEAVLAFVFLIILASFSYGYSASEIEKYVFDNFYFLKQNEKLSAEFLIQHAKQKYWILSIKSNDEIVTFLAFPDVKNPKPEKDKETNRKLFYLAFLLLKFQQLENEFLQQRNWFFTLNNANAFKNLAQLLQNEKVSLQIVENEISTENIAKLSNELTLLAAKANQIATATENAIKAKNEIFNNPSTDRIGEFESYFYMQDKDNLYALLQNFQQLATDYVTLSVALAKKDIANSDLQPATKEQLMHILDAPFSLATINQYVNSLLANKQSLDKLFSLLHSAKNPVDSFVEEFKSRRERHYAYIALYAEKQELKKITNGRISTLPQAAAEILDYKVRPLWKDQQAVISFESKYKQAESAFEREDYKVAESLAKEALKKAVSVYKHGFKKEERGFFSVELIVALAIILLLILFRKKIISLFKKEEEEGYE